MIIKIQTTELKKEWNGWVYWQSSLTNEVNDINLELVYPILEGKTKAVQIKIKKPDIGKNMEEK